MSGVPDPSSYWKKPKLLEFQADWLDPDPDTRGMLSADRIQFYVDQVRMIDPFKLENLKPASYGLRLGPSYQVEGKLKHLTALQPTLVIPPNSIVFVSMREWLRLPHYIAARFNLAIDHIYIDHIYKGLLLGTGPQVDPGFQGVLSCPLHNISNQPIRIQFDDHLATIDFIKTTGIHEGAEKFLVEILKENDLYSRSSELVGFNGFTNRLFSNHKRWVRPILAYPAGDRQVASSVADLERDIRRFRIIGTVGALTLLLTFIMAIVPLYLDLKGDLEQARAQTAELRLQLQKLESRTRPTPLLQPMPTPLPQPAP